MASITHHRHVLFISHALPEENEFVLWLAAKLRNEGYEVWCELEQVYGGEHFWKEIELLLQTKAAKMILVASHISVKKDGVRAEWDYGRELAREQRLKDFIIPLNFDGVSSNAIMGLTSLAMIQFQNSWAQGLKSLLLKLKKDNVPKSNENTPLSAAQWYLNRFATTNTVVKKQETFYSNWIALPNLPDSLFLHEYINDVQAKQIVKHIQSTCVFPVARHDRYILSFEEKMIEFQLEEEHQELFSRTKIEAINRTEISISNICNRKYKSTLFPTTQNASNFLVQLLQQTVHNFLVKRGLKMYELSSNKVCYYYQRENETDPKVKYIYQGKLRSKQLTGIYYQEDFWHYGLSFVPRLHPQPAIGVKAHIIFSKDGKSIWEDKKALQSARRKKGRLMFNAEWRDLQLAFMSSLSDDQIAFALPITSDDSMWLSTTPILFVSDQGYNDPNDEGRLVPMNGLINEEDEDYPNDFDVEGALAELDEDTGKIIKDEGTRYE